MQKTWNFHKIFLIKQRKLIADLGISPILAQVLINRGIDTSRSAEQFLKSQRSNFADAFLLKGMRKAVDRVRKAIENKEKIFIYGDYDVDGLTSCALLFYVLADLGAEVSCYIPHRMEEGYGLNTDACKSIKKKNASLMITVDCGINSFEEIKYLASLGVDTIVTDHHQPQEGKIPAAYSVINPHQKDCPYPYKELAGVGLAYKLAEALTGGTKDISEHLDLVALGTVSDMAALVGENRLFVKYGLEVLAKTKKAGLKALMEVAGISKGKISAYHIGFMLGPRINATGRMGSTEKALKLLLSKDAAESHELAKMLDQENRQRQRIEGKTLKEALNMVENEVNFKHHRSVVLHNDNWHPGVIGIVASRIAERFYRPTILISTAKTLGKGSGRSIKNFNMFDTLDKCKHLLKEFGGHEKAAGLSILRENLTEFKTIFNQLAHQLLDVQDLVPVLDIDMEIALGALSEKLIMELEKCAPFGIGNPQPLFVSRNLKLKNKPRILRANTYKLWLTDDKITCEAIANGFDFTGSENNISAAYSPSINEWQGISTIQLKLKDMRIS
ncbi:MAG: single-stranded-DNA-specific exonuclease RecJ [Candidatus Omnitrophica bacterium]|nr:single-stranded-DNA-specific exonuclease RecJ [Candidatus Omnitrophota bacterium]